MNAALAAILDASEPCSPLAVSLSKTAVLLLDFHAFIVTHQAQIDAALASAAELRDWAHEQGVLVIQGLIDLRASTDANRKMASRVNAARDKTHLGTTKDAGSVLAACEGEYTFWRPPSSVSALGSYGLDAFLKAHHIESLILAGFSTSGCIINTAKALADAGYVVTVVRDACADRNAEVHEFVTARLLAGQSHVVSVKELICAWRHLAESTLEGSDIISKAIDGLNL